MANRFPLIANSSANQIQEIPSGDNLDLNNNGIVNAGTITATTIVKSGGSSTQFLMADGTTTTGGGGIDEIESMLFG